jgi:hypothetical protein
VHERLLDVDTRLPEPSFEEFHAPVRTGDADHVDIYLARYSRVGSIEDLEGVTVAGQHNDPLESLSDYIKSEPPETWGPQQNTIVNDQLDAAQSVQISAARQQHVTDVAEDILNAQDTPGTDTT